MLKKLRKKSQQLLASSNILSSPSPAHREHAANVLGGETFHPPVQSQNETQQQKQASLSVSGEHVDTPTSTDQGALPSNPRGLTLLHAPSGIASADVVFIHGLGGTSQQTWSWNRDVNNFWPGKWLPQESDISRARIFTFGYDADFRSSTSGLVSGINDFAKDLLFWLKFGKTAASEDFNFGDKPIVFVAHSLGGLVCKKACIIGKYDDAYKYLIASVNAILFLSTPHRGSNLAESLNRILSISVLYTKKQYISEISENSTVLEEINEQFRHVAPAIKIFCFYEILQTSIGPLKHMIVEKDSSKLGYPGEISKPLRADHHNVCKYESRYDENYVSVRNTLQSLVAGYRYTRQKTSEQEARDDVRELEIQLEVTAHQLIEEDHTFFSGRRTSGTSKWILEEKTFINWYQDAPSSAVAWLQLPPASGKSILMSYIVDRLRENGDMIQYFYIRFGDQMKRSTATILKSLAHQLAHELPEFRQSLKAVLLSRPGLGHVEARALWRIVFVSQLFVVTRDRPTYWLIDGLDECETPEVFLELLSHLRDSRLPIRVLISGRPSSKLRYAFNRLSKSMEVHMISSSDISTDMRIFAQQKLEQVPWNEGLKNEVIERILRTAGGNFLWVDLIMQEIVMCHTPEAIEEVLSGMPPGMENLYQSIEAALLKSLRKGDVPMCRKILSWAALSRYPLRVEQIVQALFPEFPALLDPRHTIAHVCGQFAMIDANSRVIMLHQTARSYLLNDSTGGIALNATACHTEHAIRCLSALFGMAKLHSASLQEDHDFVTYAATSWFFHLESSNVSSQSLMDILVKFLSTRNVLDWISNLANCQSLRPITRASRVLAEFATKLRNQDCEQRILPPPLPNLVLVESWSVDFIRIVGKFGSTLKDAPDAIYKLIPALCPKDSMIYRQFVETAVISLSGIHNMHWDDNVARIITAPEARAKLVQCSTSYLAVACTNGTITVKDAVTFEEVHEIKHDEPLTAMCFAPDETLLATLGYRTSKIWNITSGQEILTLENPPRQKILTASFAPHGDALIVGFDDCSIRSIDEYETENRVWRTISSIKTNDEFFVPGHIQNSASAMAFSSDGSYAALAMRGTPLSVWQISTSSLIGRCGRNKSDRGSSSHDWAWVKCICWHPFTGDLLGIYMDGHVFKWHPFDGQNQEIPTKASDIKCSPDGTIFITSDSDGNIKFYEFSTFTLLYQISDDIISAMAISPDCRRFYDIRSNVCNVWEPHILTSLNKGEQFNSHLKKRNHSLALTFATSEGVSESRAAITALAAIGDGTSVLFGDESGAIKLHDYSTGSVAELWQSPSMMRIEQLSTNEDGTLFAFADLTATISVNRLPQKGNTPFSVLHFGIIQNEEKIESVSQILIHPLWNLLLVVRGESCQLWSIPSGDGQELKCLASAQSEAPVRFVSNPVDSSQVLAVQGAEQVSINRWEDLTTLTRISIAGIPLSPPSSSTSPFPVTTPNTALLENNEISKLFTDKANSFLVLQIPSAGRKVNDHSQIRIFPASAFSGYNADLEPPLSHSLPEQSMPYDILTNIAFPLAVLDRTRLVYVDKKHWVCTWYMGPSTRIPSKWATARRHFPVPPSWIEPEALKLCCIASDTTFLYPINGEIAAIQSDIARGW